MRYISPYHKGARIQRGGQIFRQQGAGFGSVLKSIFSRVAPVVMKGIRSLTSMGKKAAQHPEVKAAMNEIQNKAISEGVKLVKRVLTPKEQNAEKESIKRKVEEQLAPPKAKKPKKTKKAPAKKKKMGVTAKKKQVGRGQGRAIF